MTTLKCPKCRLHAPDDALDAGQCPACGFPLDGPLVLDTAASGTRMWPFLLGSVFGAAVGATGYALVRDHPAPPLEPQHELAQTNPTPPQVPPSAPVANAPKPRSPEQSLPDAPPSEEPKKGAPRPLGVVMKVDPKIAPKRHFDQPDDTAALPDLNTSDRVVLTGRVRGLRIGSVNGNGEIDASGLVAEEVVITGDLNGGAVVVLNAPNGKVALGGHIGGAAKLTVTAAGGEVVLLAAAGRVTGGATATITAKRLDLAGKVRGQAKLNATLTTGGALNFASVEENATVTYQRGAATDPPLRVQIGAIGDGAKVLAQ